MKLLVDTHILLWMTLDAPNLSAQARQGIKDAEAVYVSVASLWEIAVKVSIGKLPIDQNLLDAEVATMGLDLLSITPAHTRTLRTLPLLHRDPFDRLLVAQAMSEPFHFLTHDAALQAYSPLVIVV